MSLSLAKASASLVFKTPRFSPFSDIALTLSCFICSFFMYQFGISKSSSNLDNLP